MNWFILASGDHWIRCEVMSHVFGVATVRLYTGEKRRGKARKGLYGLIVEEGGG